MYEVWIAPEESASAIVEPKASVRRFEEAPPTICRWNTWSMPSPVSRLAVAELEPSCS